ncbi:hypothetical protein M3Y99_01806300 [Aphelenchoides fujianensis]|nr:hypothetical protein M3Y99_01806300 [Aphelenchoides fujianensis]
MDPATSKTCQSCEQEVYPRELRADGTCKSCYRKEYYKKRKDLLAARYRENREERLQKQKQYYLAKKERLKSADGAEAKPTTKGTKRRQKAAAAPQIDYSSNSYEGEKQTLDHSIPPSVGLDGMQQSSSSSSDGMMHGELDGMGGSPLMKISYPFHDGGSNSSQSLSFILPNMASGQPSYVWEHAHPNGPL